ncbi:hypothetical protein SASPL_136932 [Salvia splendens]|uniref:Uncharacterized protein n=1 Tax=Salvia splendens TaxID=180675 RepID=A0A8X8X264_SALSN|nr:uncharacterized protein LOC121761532 [Salvia splendens]KAG6404679.1 hypothetical protein SASPL_136932 [Salvia splendens]
MASSMTMTTSFFGGAFAAKPAKATTRCSPLAVRASIDSEKLVVESGNTRRGLVLAGVAAVAASSVTKVAEAAFSISGVLPVVPPDLKPVPVDPTAPDIITLAKFAVSEYNNQILVSAAGKKDVELLTFGSVLKAEKKEFFSVFYTFVISAQEGLNPSPKKYTANVTTQDSPTSIYLFTFQPTS